MREAAADDGKSDDAFDRCTTIEVQAKSRFEELAYSAKNPRISSKVALSDHENVPAKLTSPSLTCAV